MWPLGMAAREGMYFGIRGWWLEVLWGVAADEGVLFHIEDGTADGAAVGGQEEEDGGGDFFRFKNSTGGSKLRGDLGGPINGEALINFSVLVRPR